MANRTGTYVAFDGLGETNPTKSDFRYYSVIQAWYANKKIEFNYVNSHDKTNAVRDTSKRTTLYARIQERLRLSKNMVVILSSNTRDFGSILSYEIEQAVDIYSLPLIIAYVDFQVILQPHLLFRYWPHALGSKIANDQGSMIHIPFAKDPLMDSIPRFTVNGEKPLGGVHGYYSADAQRDWGLLYYTSPERNYLKS